MKTCILFLSFMIIVVFIGCSKQQPKQTEGNSSGNTTSRAVAETKRPEPSPEGSYSYLDRPASVEYRLLLSPDGSYMMTDFGGDGMIYGKWERNGYTITFYDDETGTAWTQGNFSGNSVSVRTTLGTIPFRRN